VKEKLQANMKLQRAEVRKIHESQRKIDEEEISDEEEEEEFDGEDEGKLSQNFIFNPSSGVGVRNPPIVVSSHVFKYIMYFNK
jgi:hypothetical protein